MQTSLAASEPTGLSSRVRFGPEKALLDDMFESHGLEHLIAHEISSGNLVPMHRLVMSRGLRLSAVTSPRLTGLLTEVADRIGFAEDVDLYVYPEAEVNAMAFHRLEDEQPHIVQVTSAAVQTMTDDELRFVLGHELGHLALRHYRVLLLRFTLGQQDDEAQGKQPIPQVLERRLDRWGRLAEFSADRVGFTACGRRLDPAIAAFFRMASGLGPEHLKFDLTALLEQVEHMASLDRLEVLARFSHPATPVRARALQMYADAGAEQAPRDRLQAVDAEVDGLAKLMDFEASTDLGTQARSFLLSAGILAAHADGEATEQELEVVVQLLLQVTGDPEGHLARLQDRGEAESMLAASCEWLRENSGQERFTLFGQVAVVAAIDGVLSKGEQRFLDDLAVMLAIPAKSAREIVHEALSRYVKTKTRSKSLAFGFGKSDA